MAVARFRLIKTDDGGFQFSLLGTTGRVIATSEAYRSKASCVKAIDALRAAAPGAVVDDETTSPSRTSPNTPAPVAKAARAAGRAVGKAVNAVEDVTRSLSPAKPAAPRASTTKAARASAKATGGQRRGQQR